MHCKACPYWPHVRCYLPFPYCGDEDPPEDGIDLTREELVAKCVACQAKAIKSDRNLSYDGQSGRLHGEISFDESIFATENKQGDFTADRDYLDQLRRDTSTGSTKLPPATEDALRKAVAEVVQRVDYADAAVLAHVLRRDSLASMAKSLKMTRRAAALAIRRVMNALDAADFHLRICDGDRNDAHQAATRLIEALSFISNHQAPILLGILKRDSLAEIARKCGLNSRQASFARLNSLIARLPWVRSLHVETKA